MSKFIGVMHCKGCGYWVLWKIAFAAFFVDSSKCPHCRGTWKLEAAR